MFPLNLIGKSIVWKPVPSASVAEKFVMHIMDDAIDRVPIVGMSSMTSKLPSCLLSITKWTHAGQIVNLHAVSCP